MSLDEMVRQIENVVYRHTCVSQRNRYYFFWIALSGKIEPNQAIKWHTTLKEQLCIYVLSASTLCSRVISLLMMWTGNRAYKNYLIVSMCFLTDCILRYTAYQFRTEKLDIITTHLVSLSWYSHFIYSNWRH